MLLAAIDIGTNSTKMTVANVSVDGQLTVISEVSEVTRLGEGVDASKRLTEAAMERTLEAVERFAVDARRQGAAEVLGAGTSALRDAANGAEFLALAKLRAGVEIQIISGDREAQLAYAAVRSDSTLKIPPDVDLLVFDIGGGSTELILGDHNGVGRHKSLNIGAVRLTERYLHSDPPTSDELKEAEEFVCSTLQSFELPEGAMPRVAGIGGTALNIAAVTLGIVKPDPDAVHGLTVTQSAVADAFQRFCSVSLAERRHIPGLEPKRADIIIAGALLLNCLLEHFQADSFLLSARGLRYGLLADYAKSCQ
jgi:exopolyphosphatase/guanosine-5'-triphosphate,3'-diphosphate pyrophosphatase